MKTKKNITSLVVIILLSLFSTGCIPNLPTGGGVTPVNEQNIGIAMKETFLPNTTTISTSANIDKTVVVDGDSIIIKAIYIVKKVQGMSSEPVDLAYLNFAIVTNANSNWYILSKYANNTIDSNYANRLSMCNNYTSYVYDVNSTVGDSIINTYDPNGWGIFHNTWEPASALLNPTEYLNDSRFKTMIFQGGSTYGGPTLNLYYPGINFYIILKKETAIGNKYFWIKTSTIESITGLTTLTTSFTHRFISIKYNYNTITTGQ